MQEGHGAAPCNAAIQGGECWSCHLEGGLVQGPVARQEDVLHEPHGPAKHLHHTTPRPSAPPWGQAQHAALQGRPPPLFASEAPMGACHLPHDAGTPVQKGGRKTALGQGEVTICEMGGALTGSRREDFFINALAPARQPARCTQPTAEHGVRGKKGARRISEKRLPVR
jgi:hypothetical protein